MSASMVRIVTMDNKTDRKGTELLRSFEYHSCILFCAYQVKISTRG